MHWYVFLGLFVLGLAFGSFLNVVAIRYQPSGGRVFSKKAVGGRSKCLTCEKTLRWFELLPLFSFFLLRRKCRLCKGPISWQYPIVEFLSGAIFTAVPFYFARFYNIGNLFYFRPENVTFYLYVFIWIVILWLLLLMSAIDFRLYLIPNEISLMIFFSGAAVVALKTLSDRWLSPFAHFFVKNYALIFSVSQSLILNHILGFLAGGIFFWFLYFLTRGKAMGFGDVKLAFALGLLMGWPDIVLVSMLSFIFGGIWGVWLLVGRKKSMQSKMPFGPFLALGVFTTVFFGHSILSWYFGLFSI